jgi:hypothetical protein
MSKDGFIKVYPMGRGLNGVIYRGEREDGTPVEGCLETANASSQASRAGALAEVLNRMEATGEFDHIILPEKDMPWAKAIWIRRAIKQAPTSTNIRQVTLYWIPIPV